MESRSILPVASGSGILGLVTSEGRPAWPVRTDAELADLRDLAGVFGATVEETPAHEGSTYRGEEVVWGLGEDAFAAAELYAHLTERHLRLENHWGPSTPGLGFASVIVTTAAHFSYELLDRVYSRGIGQPLTGFVVAANPELLHRQVLLRSATSVLCGPMRKIRIDIAPTFKARTYRKLGTRVLGEDAQAGQIREAISAGAGLLNIMTHSDGVDAYFGSTTLCPMDSQPDLAAAARPPRCVVRGVCHRHPMSLHEARQASFLIRAKDAAARLIVFHTCRGALPLDSLVDPNWGIIPKLLENPRVGAVATTWEMALLIQQDLERAAAPLQRGVSAGRALADFLDQPEVRRRSVRMCLFGDPRMRLPSSPVRSSRRAAVPSSGEPDQRAFLETFVHYQRSHAAPDAQTLVSKVEKALSRYPMFSKGTKPATDAAGSAVREALMDLVCHLGSRPASDWNQFAKIARTFPTPSPCPQCGRRTQTWIMRILARKGFQRRMINCSRCGFVDDSPADYPNLAMWLEGTVLHLAGSRPQLAWSARVLIDPGLGKGELPVRRWVPWPAGMDGTPLHRLDIGDSLAPWPMNLTLVLVDGLSLVLLTCNARA